MDPLLRNPVPDWLAAVMAALAGVALGVGFAPIDIWMGPLVGVAMLTWAVVGRGFWASVALGSLAGLAMNLVTIQWISVLGTAVAAVLIIFMSTWTGLLGGLVAVLSRQRLWALSIPGAWVLVEQLSGSVPFGGFPWNRLAYTTVDQPLGEWLPIVGSVGVSYLVALAAHLLLMLPWRGGRRLPALVAGVALFAGGVVVSLVPFAQESDDHLTVGMVQGNVNRAAKGTSFYASQVTNNHLSETIFLLARNRATSEEPLDFVVWPENATDVDPLSDADTRATVDLAAGLADVPILVGAVMDGPDPITERQTSALWWDPHDGASARYDKRNLVPFGEWIPFREVLLPRMPILEQIGRQSIPGEGPGVLPAPVADRPGLVVGGVICFELAWDSTVYDTVRHGAELLVSQSNTNTYGATLQVPQQLQLNRVRAMELRRDVVASTLNSTSALIESDGDVVGLTREFTAANRTFAIPAATHLTPAVVVSPWLGWAIVAGTVAAVIGAVAGRFRRDAAVA